MYIIDKLFHLICPCNPINQYGIVQNGAVMDSTDQSKGKIEDQKVL